MQHQSTQVLSTIAFTFLFVSQIQASDDSYSISIEQVTPHLNYLASPDRQGRDDWGKIEARDYIINHFESLDLKPLFPDGFIQAIPQFGDESADPQIKGQNIGAFIEGTDPDLKDEWIIVNAHYDHLGIKNGKIYPGADDNASGVSMLLEVARSFSTSPARRSVAFVAFDLEEHLLWGSRWFVAHSPIELEQFKCCLTADMIGRSLGGLDLPTIFVMGSEKSPEVREVLEQTLVPDGLDVAQLGIDIVGSRSDYAPFFLHRIPFLFFSTGEHPDYHTPQDTLEKLDIPKIAKVSTLMNRIAHQMADLPGEITWDGKTEPGIEEVEAINRVTKRLLAAEVAGDLELSDLQRFFISHIHSITSSMLSRKQITTEERKWLIRSTKMMMLSTF